MAWSAGFAGCLRKGVAFVSLSFSLVSGPVTTSPRTLSRRLLEGPGSYGGSRPRVAGGRALGFLTVLQQRTTWRVAVRRLLPRSGNRCVCAWGGLQPKPRPRKRRAPSLGGRVPCERLAAAARPRARCSSLSFYLCCIGDADARVGMCRARTSAAARASGWWTRCTRPVGQKSPQRDWQSRPARPVGCPGAGGQRAGSRVSRAHANLC